MTYDGTCHYGKCWLPQNNKKYWWQAGFLLLSLLVLLSVKSNFTFTNICLFIVPVMIDLVTTELKSKTWNLIRWLFRVLNGVLLIFCILGFMGVIVENKEYFALKDSFLFLENLPVKSVEKGFIGKFLWVDLIVPLVFCVGAPCQDGLHILEIDERIATQKKENSK